VLSSAYTQQGKCKVIIIGLKSKWDPEIVPNGLSNIFNWLMQSGEAERKIASRQICDLMTLLKLIVGIVLDLIP